MQSEGVDSDQFSGSNSSFLANEKLMSVESMNSDITGMIAFIPEPMTAVAGAIVFSGCLSVSP